MPAYQRVANLAVVSPTQRGCAPDTTRLCPRHNGLIKKGHFRGCLVSKKSMYIFTNLLMERWAFLVFCVHKTTTCSKFLYIQKHNLPPFFWRCSLGGRGGKKETGNNFSGTLKTSLAKSYSRSLFCGNHILVYTFVYKFK